MEKNRKKDFVNVLCPKMGCSMITPLFSPVQDFRKSFGGDLDTTFSLNLRSGIHQYSSIPGLIPSDRYVFFKLVFYPPPPPPKDDHFSLPNQKIEKQIQKLSTVNPLEKFRKKLPAKLECRQDFGSKKSGHLGGVYSIQYSLKFQHLLEIFENQFYLRKSRKR